MYFSICLLIIKRSIFIKKEIGDFKKSRTIYEKMGSEKVLIDTSFLIDCFRKNKDKAALVGLFRSCI